MRTLLIATALMMCMSGSAFAKKWAIPLEEVDVPAERCGEALEKGKRSIATDAESMASNIRFWYDGMVWKIWFEWSTDSYDRLLFCRAFKPMWRAALGGASCPIQWDFTGLETR